MNSKRDELTRQIMDNFRRIVQALRTSNRVAEHFDLTGAQLFVLSVLHETDQPMSIVGIARETQTDPSTVSVVVGKLVERGYVKRTRSDEDTRRAALTLTARGRALHRTYPQSLPQLRLAKALARLSPADAKKLDRILAIVVEDMGLGDLPAVMMFSNTKTRRVRSSGGQAPSPVRARVRNTSK